MIFIFKIEFEMKMLNNINFNTKLFCFSIWWSKPTRTILLISFSVSKKMKSRFALNHFPDSLDWFSGWTLFGPLSFKIPWQSLLKNHISKNQPFIEEFNSKWYSQSCLDLNPIWVDLQSFFFHLEPRTLFLIQI